ncbi:PfkB family carbohydrate kinase [Sanguibacter suaedae]|uniref:Carbohydrate kinase PfkB domain-containing protein n=1 Tax=Sanguibacter suaedae TaxID=2795737 RepID=A0A934M724_9MICO|nr:PfkB family carbohydrate kinase [Sanguibacter suaedae]MBI9114912.1 hypothetical protein [Sanguibacter suaedae]
MTALRPVGVFGGLTTLDIVHRADRAPGRDEKITAVRQDVAAGGPAANAAVVFAALGGRARLVTVLGRGAVARIARDDLESHGVEIVDVAPDLGTDLGVSAVRVDARTGERSVLSMDASAVTPSTDEVATTLDAVAALHDADVLLLDGHHPALARALAASATDLGVPIVLDAGRWRPVMADLVPVSRTVVASATFRWQGTDGEVATHPPLSKTSAGSASGPQEWAVTHGPGPVDWWTGEARGVVEVPSVDAVDTLGAGDAFHGAFAYGTATGAGSLPERLAAAAQVAALRVQVLGPRDWLRRLTRADESLREERWTEGFSRPNR